MRWHWKSYAKCMMWACCSQFSDITRSLVCKVYVCKYASAIADETKRSDTNSVQTDPFRFSRLSLAHSERVSLNEVICSVAFIDFSMPACIECQLCCVTALGWLGVQSIVSKKPTTESYLDCLFGQLVVKPKHQWKPKTKHSIYIVFDFSIQKILWFHTHSPQYYLTKWPHVNRWKCTCFV